MVKIVGIYGIVLMALYCAITFFVIGGWFGIVSVVVSLLGMSAIVFIMRINE